MTQVRRAEHESALDFLKMGASALGSVAHEFTTKWRGTLPDATAATAATPATTATPATPTQTTDETSDKVEKLELHVTLLGKMLDQVVMLVHAQQVLLRGFSPGLPSLDELVTITKRARRAVLLTRGGLDGSVGPKNITDLVLDKEYEETLIDAIKRHSEAKAADESGSAA